jgi:hypothetical protein
MRGFSERSESLHGLRVHQFRNRPRGDDPVFQREAGADRPFAPVGHHVPCAIGPARDLGPVHDQRARLQPVQVEERPVETGVGEHHLRREPARLQQPAGAVHVFHDQFEEPRPLIDPRLQPVPFGRSQNQRYQVEPPGALRIAQIAKDVEGHAVVAQQAVGFGCAAGELLGGEFLQSIPEGAPLRMELPPRGEHLVVHGARRPVAVPRRFHRLNRRHRAGRH